MNCKECIHYEVCSAWWVFVENFDDIRTEESCDYFKEKTTVGAEPVRHGKWTGKGFAYKCSACGNREPESTKEYAERYWHYCPNCGAKMDGGESDG